MPRFTVILPHYDGTVSDADLQRCFRSLQQQTLQDFEVRLYHDGPLSRPLPELPACGVARHVVITDTRANDFGHSLRSLGIAAAEGDYLVHLNADNVLYPRALEQIDRAARLPIEPAPSPEMRDNPRLLVFAILMRGRRFNGRVGYWRDPNGNHTGTLLTGMPPMMGYIDCMQLVAHREVWRAAGGWYDLGADSDGRIYPRLIAEYGARYLPLVLGEHW